MLADVVITDLVNKNIKVAAIMFETTQLWKL